METASKGSTADRAENGPLHHRLLGQEDPDLSPAIFAGFWEKMSRRRVLALSICVCFLVLGIAGCMLPRHYKSLAQIRIQPSASKQFSVSAISLAAGDQDDAEIATEAMVLQSRTLYLQVAQQMDLANNNDFWAPEKNGRKRSYADPRVRDEVFRRIDHSITVTRAPKNQMIAIEVSARSAMLSADIANALITAYIERVYQMRYGATDRVTKWLTSEMEGLRKQVESDQVELVKLQGRLGIIGFDPKTAVSTEADSLSDINRASNEATINRIVAQARYLYLDRSDPSLIEGEPMMLASRNQSANGTDTLLQSLRQTKAQLAATYSNLQTRFGPNYPEMKQVKAQLDAVSAQVDEEEKRVVNQSKISYDAALANEKMTSVELAKSRAMVSDSQSDIVKFAILDQDYEGHRGLYTALVRRLQEAGIDAGLESAIVDVVDLADVPSEPAIPGPFLIMMAAALLGIIMGAVAVLIAENLDTRLKDPADMERRLHLVNLSVLPHINGPESQAGETDSAYIEAIQQLRTAVLFSSVDKPPKVIMITSASKGEGKSTTARNLAVAYAQYDNKVLLVDADLRRGRQDRALGLRSTLGLSSVLSGHSTLPNCILPVPGHANLSMLPAGPVPPLPALLIASDRMKQLMLDFRESYDIIILDVPPVLAVTDPVIASSYADAVLLVGRMHISSVKAIAESAKILEHAGALLAGVVCNDIDIRFGYYQQYYGSYYGNQAGRP